MASCEPPSSYRSVVPVTISYLDLEDKSKDLSAKIEEGLGPDGLGIISISDVPKYSLLRQNLLNLSPRVLSLSDDEKSSLEDPDSSYYIGWHHGKRWFEAGKPDKSRTSFCANPIFDVPTTDESLMQRYPSNCRPNKWPTSALPELEVAFKSLGKLMFDVGLMLGYHCDKYVSKAIKFHGDEGLEQILKCSRNHKGALLHYFPKQQSDHMENNGYIPSWCGWHTDHGSLTGLTCAMCTRNAEKITCPDDAGLHIKTRNEEIVKVVLGEDDLAYQIGETTELLSGGLLCATPHCVQAPSRDKAIGVERFTFALFMQPNWDENLKFPEVIRLHQELVQPNASFTYGEYFEKIGNRIYAKVSSEA